MPNGKYSVQISEWNEILGVKSFDTEEEAMAYANERLDKAKAEDSDFEVLVYIQIARMENECSVWQRDSQEGTPK